MDEKALAVLELDAVKEILGERIQTPMGRRALADLRPSTDPAEVRRLQDETTQLRTALAGRVPLPSIADLPDLMERARGVGYLEPDDLLAVAGSLDTASEVRDVLEEAAGIEEGAGAGAAGTGGSGGPSPTPIPGSGGEEGDEEPVEADRPRLRALARRLPRLDSLVGEIRSTIDRDGEVRNDASEELAEIRREIDRLEDRIRTELARIQRDPNVQKAMQAPHPTIRNDRFVLPIRSEDRKRVEGVVLDRSQTGATVYIEPHTIVGKGNDLADRRAEERQEVTRILAERTRAVLARSDDVERLVEGLAAVDLASARARWAEEGDHRAPRIEDPGGALDLKAARHPLLVRQAKENRLPSGEVVPVDARIGDDFDILIITGPNTGGKTVTLKTVGLLAAMAQCGLHLPCRTGSRVPVFERIFCDIGDEQSIEQSLSTFSSHVERIVPALRGAGPRDLVLVDELGAGTDPSEGAALGVAILERLLDRETRVLVTTHIGRLKDLAYRLPRVENAACEFDPETLSPTYRLLLGQAGASHAFEVSRRLGLPGPVLDRAEELRAEEGRDLGVEADEVANLRLEAERRLQEADEVRDEARELAAEAEEARDRLAARERSLEAEMDQEMDETFRTLEREVQEACEELENAPEPFAERAGTLVERVEEILDRTAYGERRRQFARHVKPGLKVWVIPFEKRGVVKRVNRSRERLEVDLGGMSADVAFRDVSWVEPR